MTNLMRRIIAMGAATVMAISVMSMGASAYTLRYTSGAPDSENRITATTIMRSTGKSAITVNSTEFRTYISGAYAKATCTTHSAVSQNINSVGTYKLTYSGGVIPAKNVNVSVQTKLYNYTTSKSVNASGSISL